MTLSNAARNRGAALVVGLIMLVLITLMLIAALNLGTSISVPSATCSSARKPSPLRTRRSTRSSARLSPITRRLPRRRRGHRQRWQDTTTRYSRRAAVRFAAQAFGADPSSLTLPASMTVASTWNTVWDIRPRSTAPTTRVARRS